MAKFFIALLAALMVVSASAQTTCLLFRATIGGSQSEWMTSRDAAFADALSKENARLQIQFVCPPVSGRNSGKRVLEATDAATWKYRSRNQSCQATGGGHQLGPETFSTVSTAAFSQMSGACPPPCATGVQSSGDYFIGFSDPVSGNAVGDTVPYAASLPGQTSCRGTCAVSLGVPTNIYLNQSEPLVNGYARTYGTYPETSTGSVCSPADTIDPPGPAPAPVEDPPPNPPDPSDPPPDDGGGGTGGDPDPTPPGNTDPTPTPTDPGGSGTGTGGGTGGGVGGGTGDTPGDPAGDPAPPCGGPGEPVCNVRIDETGTPTETNRTFDAASTALNVNKTAVQTAVDSLSASQPLPGWTWAFMLPTGCSPLPLEGYGFSLDVCQFQPTIHDLMSLLWAAAGIFGLLGLARSAFSGA